MGQQAKVRRFILLACFATLTQMPVDGASEPTILIIADGMAGGQLKEPDLRAVQSSVTNFLGQQLRKKYTCYDIMTRDNLQAIAGFMRSRQLLGTEGSERDLEQLGIAMKRDYVVIVSVAGLGKEVALIGRALKTSSAQAIARHSAKVPNDKNLLTAIDQFAEDFADKIEISGLKCKPLPWVGTIRLVETRSWSQMDEVPANDRGVSGYTKKTGTTTLDATYKYGYADMPEGTSIVRYSFKSTENYESKSTAHCDNDPKKPRGTATMQLVRTVTQSQELPAALDLDPESEELTLELGFPFDGVVKVNGRSSGSPCGGGDTQNISREEPFERTSLGFSHTIKVPLGIEPAVGTWTETRPDGTKRTLEWNLRRNTAASRTSGPNVPAAAYR